MKQPIWIINSSLLASLLLLQGLVYIFHVSVPRRASLKPSAVQASTSVAVQSIDLEQIYKNDIFNTYIDETAATQLLKNQVPDLPEAPAPLPVSIPEIEQPAFVSPLDVTLKGIMFLADDQLNCVAIVQDNTSKVETNYRIGEFIEDAQVLKIFPDKTLVIRSNGQQEMLYLREEDAAKDLDREDFSVVEAGVVFAVEEDLYAINVIKFIDKINNLGQFVDMLGLTTVYHQGKASGCRVGAIGTESLGVALGFQEGDIITEVEGSTVGGLKSRIAVYEELIKKQVGDSVYVTVSRDDETISLRYDLVDEARAKVLAEKYGLTASDLGTDELVETLSRSSYEVEKQRQNILSRKVAIAPTKRDIEKQEMKNLLNARRSGAYGYMNE